MPKIPCNCECHRQNYDTKIMHFMACCHNGFIEVESIEKHFATEFYYKSLRQHNNDNNKSIRFTEDQKDLIIDMIYKFNEKLNEKI